MENSQLPSPATQPVQSLPALADPSYTLPSSPTNTPSTSTTAPALPLLFSPLNSSISPSFWQELTRRKLFELQLSTDPLPVYASYARGRSTTDRATGEEISFGCLLELSFEPTGASPARVQLRGILQNFNTIEEFKSVDKTALMESIGDEVNIPTFCSLACVLTSYPLRSGRAALPRHPHLSKISIPFS